MHEVLVNRLGGLSLPRKSVVRLTDRPDMTLDVYRGHKTTMQQRLVCSYVYRIVLLTLTPLLIAISVFCDFKTRSNTSVGSTNLLLFTPFKLNYVLPCISEVATYDLEHKQIIFDPDHSSFIKPGVLASN